jgi:hypothetical protein
MPALLTTNDRGSNEFDSSEGGLKTSNWSTSILKVRGTLKLHIDIPRETTSPYYFIILPSIIPT